jgi:hypothetical protein
MLDLFFAGQRVNRGNYLMNIKTLIQWQYKGYSKYHKSKLNLWFHILAVPLFIYGLYSTLYYLINLDFSSSFYSAILMVTSIILQGIGHKQEELPPEEFTGARNAILRIFFEQHYSFPKFFITGDWYKELIK